VWSYSKDDGIVSKVDPATDRVVVRISVVSSDPGAVSLAYGAGGLWISDGAAGTLARISPKGTGGIVGKLPKISTIQATADRLWAVVGGADGDRVVQLDPAKI
jgi:hypothetical protein